MNTYEKRGRGGLLSLTRHPTKGVCPERPSGVKDLSWNPTKDSCPEEHRDEGPFLTPDKGFLSCLPDPVGEEHCETTEGSDLVGKDLSSQPMGATNNAPYFAASNSRIITRSTSSGCGSGSFNTNSPLTALNSTLLPFRSDRADRTGRGIPASASTGWFQSST